MGIVGLGGLLVGVPALPWRCGGTPGSHRRGFVRRLFDGHPGLWPAGSDLDRRGGRAERLVLVHPGNGQNRDGQRTSANQKERGTAHNPLIGPGRVIVESVFRCRTTALQPIYSIASSAAARLRLICPPLTRGSGAIRSLVLALVIISFGSIF